MRIRCRLPTSKEARHLRTTLTNPVFETDVTNVDERGVPVFFATTSFCGGRVEFVLEL
jgi:DNA-binding GntR family transcriptional regulator